MVRLSPSQSPPTNPHQPVLWYHDVIALTGDVIEFLETQIKGEGDGDLLKEFHKGNDQINYGYTDKGLNKANSKDKINFGECGTQLAYVYRFFTSHVLIMGELLMSASGWCGVRFPPLKPPLVYDLRAVNKYLDNLSSSSDVTVTCFGGGPVSEVAAIVAWLRNEGITCRLSFTILDKYSAWEGVATEVAEFCHTSLEYQQLDFLTSQPELFLPYVESQHILCMSKFLSALTAHRETASRNLRWVLEHMAPGALLVYIDNSGGGTTELVTKVATSCCLKEVFSIPHFAANIKPDALSPNERRSFYKVKATNNLNVAFKIFQKDGDMLPLAENNSDEPSHFFRSKYYHRVGFSTTST